MLLSKYLSNKSFKGLKYKFLKDLSGLLSIPGKSESGLLGSGITKIEKSTNMPINIPIEK